MAEGVPRERRATTCRGDGSERRPADPTVGLQKQITALADAISRMGVLLSTLTKQVVDDENIRASQQQFVRGCEQRRGDREYSQRYTQRRRHKRHGHARGRCYGCGSFGHFRRECTRFWKQSYEQERGSRYQGNVQEIHSTGCATSHLHGGCTTGSRSDNTTTFGHSLVTRTLCESARADRNYPITKRLVAYQQGAHVRCDVQRDSEMDLEKRRTRATPESRSGESCAVSTSERRHLSAEKHNTPIGTSVSCEKQTRVSRHTQTLTIQDALPVVSVSPRSHPERPHNVADETSREDPVKHDIVDVDGGHKTSDERPMTVRSMLPRKARHDANVTECTLAIGDFVYIRDRTWRGRNKIQDIWSHIVHVVICVPYVGNNVYVVRPATGGPAKTLNRVALLPARPPVTEVEDYPQEDSLSDDEAILIVPGIDTVADLSGIVEAVPTGVDDVTIPRRSTRTTAGVPPDRYCCEQLTLTESRPTLPRDYFCVIA